MAAGKTPGTFGIESTGGGCPRRHDCLMDSQGQFEARTNIMKGLRRRPVVVRGFFCAPVLGATTVRHGRVQSSRSNSEPKKSARSAV